MGGLFGGGVGAVGPASGICGCGPGSLSGFDRSKLKAVSPMLSSTVGALVSPMLVSIGLGGFDGMGASGLGEPRASISRLSVVVSLTAHCHMQS